MPVCDMCGSPGHLVMSKVEGSMMHVCEKCARFGHTLETPEAAIANRQRTAAAFSIPKETVVENYASLIKAKREKLGKNQEDFAKMLNEKLSFLHSIESGHHEPPIALARKFEKMLRIKLVETEESGDVPLPHSKHQGFTLGDLLKKR